MKRKRNQEEDDEELKSQIIKKLKTTGISLGRALLKRFQEWFNKWKTALGDYWYGMVGGGVGGAVAGVGAAAFLSQIAAPVVGSLIAGPAFPVVAIGAAVTGMYIGAKVGSTKESFSEGLKIGSAAGFGTVFVAGLIIRQTFSEKEIATILELAIKLKDAIIGLVKKIAGCFTPEEYAAFIEWLREQLPVRI